jgi:tRNA(fMet)-specific endonuclease VapC
VVNYLLDTNACIVYLKTPWNPVRDRLDVMVPQDLRMCSVVKAELIYGATRYSDPAARLDRLEEFFAPFESLPFDDAAAEAYGRIRSQLQRSGRLPGPNDLLIAAIAVANNLVVVTHNTDEFSRVPGLTVEDWQA